MKIKLLSLITLKLKNKIMFYINSIRQNSVPSDIYIHLDDSDKVFGKTFANLILLNITLQDIMSSLELSYV